MEKINKTQIINDINKVLIGCNNLLGSLRIRVEDLDESGQIIKIVRENLARCSGAIEKDLLTPESEPLKFGEEEPVNEEGVDNDGNADTESEPESAPAEPDA